MIRTLLAVALLAAPLPALAQPGATLTLDFANLTAREGKVMIAIFDEASWDRGAPVKVAMADASAASVRAVIAGLQPGRYGVKAFRDADGDGKMGMNPFGIPTEQFGFSNDAMGNRSAPAWADAAFEVTASGAVQTITLR